MIMSSSIPYEFRLKGAFFEAVHMWERDYEENGKNNG